LANNELVCFTGDRYFEGTKSLSEKILGEEAHFPVGPFLIASRLKVPVVFVYVMKEPTYIITYMQGSHCKTSRRKGFIERICTKCGNHSAKIPVAMVQLF
jgi:predicted LPLAT superfamily acyltransferase